MKEIALRFTSRKFLLTLLGLILVMASPEHVTEIVALIGLFIGAEGAKDVSDSIKRNS